MNQVLGCFGMTKLFCLLISCCLVLASYSEFLDLYSIHRREIQTFEKYVDKQHDLKDIINEANGLIDKFDKELDRLVQTDYETHFDDIQNLFKWRKAISEQLESDKRELASIKLYFETMSMSRLHLIVEYHRSLQESLLEKYRLASRQHDLRRILLLRKSMENSSWYYSYATYLLSKRHSESISRISSRFT